MEESIRQIADRISQLKIQGARNIAIAAIKALEKMSEETKAKNKNKFLEDLFKAQNILFSSRETEPLMRNAIKWIISQVENSDEKNVNILSKIVASSASQFLKNLEDSKTRIAAIGSKRIKNKSIILTHCHSSTVTKLLIKANKDGKNFEVFCTETRPLFQGRITAKELIKEGIKTTLIVDSAVRSIMKESGRLGCGGSLFALCRLRTSSVFMMTNPFRASYTAEFQGIIREILGGDK